MPTNRLGSGMKSFVSSKNIAGSWLVFSLLICFILFFLHVNIFAVIGFGLIFFLPFGFFFFKNSTADNSLHVQDKQLDNVVPPQKIFQNNEKFETQEDTVVKKAAIQKYGFDKKDEASTYFKNKIDSNEIQNTKDLHTDSLNEALRDGVVVKSEELEKIAKKNNTQLNLIIGLNSWLLGRFSLNMDTVLLVDGEKIAISDNKEITVNIDEMMADNSNNKELDANSDLLENIQNELNISNEELEAIANEIKISNVKNSVELEKSSLKETANIHQSGFLKST